MIILHMPFSSPSPPGEEGLGSGRPPRGCFSFMDGNRLVWGLGGVRPARAGCASFLFFSGDLSLHPPMLLAPPLMPLLAHG